MKKYFLSALLISLSVIALGQMEIPIKFDNSLGLDQVFINTKDFPNNKWQIGAPKKKVFKSAYSSPNVIVTDTINSYPVNNTSVFIVKTIAGGGFTGPHTVTVAGQYYVNSDSLTDTGTIEFSHDKGKTWIDLINPGSYSSYINWRSSEKPVLTGNSNGWKYFSVSLAKLGPVLNIHNGDTVLYKFSFKSDAIQTNKDGLMYDNFVFIDYLEDIPEIQNDNLIAIYPNPTSNQLIITETEKQNCPTVQILNSVGQVVYSDNCFKGGTIDIKQLSEGIYYLRYVNPKSFAIKKFLVNHQ